MTGWLNVKFKGVLSSASRAGLSLSNVLPRGVQRMRSPRVTL